MNGSYKKDIFAFSAERFEPSLRVRFILWILWSWRNSLA